MPYIRIGWPVPDQVQGGGNIDVASSAANVPPGGQSTTLHASVVCSATLDWPRAPPCNTGKLENARNLENAAYIDKSILAVGSCSLFFLMNRLW
jgi:hypothetical protein